MSDTRSRDEVPVEPIRQAFLRSGINASQLARELGWTRPDTARVRRQLGMRPDSNGHGSPVRLRETMDYGRALEIALVLGVDPTEVGL